MINCVYYTPELRCYRDGKVERYYENKCRWGDKGWNLCELTPNKQGYLRINIDGIYYQIQRLIAFCFLGLENISGTQANYDGVIDHINGIKIDNRIENLRCITVQKNTFNRHNTKGYSWNERAKKWKGHILLNGKPIHLGYHDTEEDARNAYLRAKEQYHII